MTSWLGRLARELGFGDIGKLFRELLPDHPGKHLAVKDRVIERFDVETPAWILQCLSEGTGCTIEQLERTTLAYWVPPMRHAGAKGHFNDYVAGFEVLEPLCWHYRPILLSGSKRKEPSLPWVPSEFSNTIVECSQCFDTDGIHRITNRFGLVSSCPLHDRDLVRDRGTERVRRTADLYTVMALRHGSVELPSGVVVTGQWWLRLLRSLIQEVFFAEPFLVGHHTYAEPFLKVWRATGEARPGHGFSTLQASLCFEDLAIFERLKYVAAASAELEMLLNGQLRPPERSHALHLARL